MGIGLIQPGLHAFINHTRNLVLYIQINTVQVQSSLVDIISPSMSANIIPRFTDAGNLKMNFGYLSVHFDLRVEKNDHGM